MPSFFPSHLFRTAHAAEHQQSDHEKARIIGREYLSARSDVVYSSLRNTAFLTYNGMICAIFFKNRHVSFFRNGLKFNAIALPLMLAASIMEFRALSTIVDDKKTELDKLVGTTVSAKIDQCSNQPEGHAKLDQILIENQQEQTQAKPHRI